MKKIFGLFLITLVMSGTFLVLIPQNCAAASPDLIINSTAVSGNPYRHLIYNVKNIGDFVASASIFNPFYCDIYIQYYYQSENYCMLSTPMYLTSQAFISSIWPGQTSPNHHYYKTIESSPGWQYRFCIYADSTDKFPGEDNNNWGYTVWFE